MKTPLKTSLYKNPSITKTKLHTLVVFAIFCINTYAQRTTSKINGQTATELAYAIATNNLQARRNLSRARDILVAKESNKPYELAQHTIPPNANNRDNAFLDTRTQADKNTATTPIYFGRYPRVGLFVTTPRKKISSTKAKMLFRMRSINFSLSATKFFFCGVSTAIPNAKKTTKKQQKTKNKKHQKFHLLAENTTKRPYQIVKTLTKSSKVLTKS